MIGLRNELQCTLSLLLGNQEMAKPLVIKRSTY